MLFMIIVCAVVTVGGFLVQLLLLIDDNDY